MDNSINFKIIDLNYLNFEHRVLNRAEYLTFMENMYRDILENLKVDKIPDYFSPKYVQTTGGENIDYQGFIDQVKDLKQHVESIQVLPLEETICEGNKMALRYLRRVTKRNGLLSNVAVLGIFEIQDDKLVRCWELSKVIVGEKEDKALDAIP
jgi:predicted SnoaL-like aldol condensation-catalyzing enzyme